MPGHKYSFTASAASLVVLIVVFFSGIQVAGQISPGELHRTHASLEGIDNCGACHSPQGDQLADKCLACHTAIAARRERKLGLHGRADYAECNLCHVEHHGRGFDLIYFKGGTAAFDHTQTGYRLAGKHARLDCRECHRRDFIRDSAILGGKDVSLDRTYLGLDRACSSCHLDEHRGQLGADCSRCHALESWRPAGGFDHAASAFPLRGRHLTTPCAKCHGLETDAHAADPDFSRFKPLRHEMCSDCHRDPHAARLGSNCESCHTADSWQAVSTVGFDHSRTRYPLEGRHAAVECEKCHGGRTTATAMKFGACRDCHRDFHDGAFAARPQAGACEECHTVYRFRPSTFRLDQHAQTDYPLRGAHLAVPCDQCHRPTSGIQPVSYRFAFHSSACTECHADAHQGGVDRSAADRGCLTCHNEDGWRGISFDHGATTFPLDGRHAAVACVKCHPPGEEAAKAPVRFSPVERRCAGCHQDFHRGQFADAAGATDCLRCHTAEQWRPAKFDHNRDARFGLQGAHSRVPCARCHPGAEDAAGTFVRYRPLDMTCRACHGDSAVNQETGT